MYLDFLAYPVGSSLWRIRHQHTHTTPPLSTPYHLPINLVVLLFLALVLVTRYYQQST